jgi:putative ABC transport system permease protein
MALTDFAIVRRSLRSRMFSTCVTAVTVAVAVGLMLVLLSMRDAGQQAFNRGSGNMHLLVSRDSSPLVSVLNGIYYANAPRAPIPWDKYEQLAGAFPLEFAIPTQLGDSYRGFPVLATTPEFFTAFEPNPDEPWVFAAGRAFDKPFEVVVGATAARETGLRVGSELFLTHGIPQSRQLGQQDAMAPHEHREFIYTVVGVLVATGSAHDRALFTDLNSAWVIHAHDRRKNADASVRTTSVDDLIESDRLITGIYIRVATRPGQQVTASLQTVFDQLRRDTSIVVAQPVQQINALFAIVSNIDQVFIAMAAVVMISSAISIMLALYNSLEQRRRQIAVLRVLGCSRPRIFGLLVTEATVIGLLGAGLGVVLAVAGAFAAAAALKEAIGLVVTPVFGLELTLAVVTGAVLLAAAAGVIPAINAYRAPVADNLKPLG